MKLQILHSTDSNGKPVVKVPLSNSNQFATLYEQDFNDLTGLGLSLKWSQASDGMVRVNVTGRPNLSVARLVTNAFKETVSYANGDKTDLRRDNLILDDSGRGNAKSRARDLVKPRSHYNKLEIEHVYKQQRVTSTGAGSVHD